MSDDPKPLGASDSSEFGRKVAAKASRKIKAVTPLIGQILIASEAHNHHGANTEMYLFYNRTTSAATYSPVRQRLLPLDETWRKNLEAQPWPNTCLPEVLGTPTTNLSALIREYLFVSLFRACAESLASENATRLSAMQRADKNIEELLESLNRQYHHMRQNDIDEELFDVISGFEALNQKSSGS